jgi:hypothetical protein
MNVKRTRNTVFDQAVIDAAEQTTHQVIAELLGRPGTFKGRPRAVIVTAPAGAGKSELVVNALRAARALGLRVVVASPTNDQAFGLVRRVWERHVRHSPGERVSFCPASDRALPDHVRKLPGVEEVSARDANDRLLVVATLAKLGDAFARGTLRPFDLLLIDESYQADAARYFAAAGLAPVHLLVGDSGQISPFSTMPEPCRWRGLPEDPLQTAVGVLRRNHPQTPVHGLPITRRLDHRAVAVARHFYTDLKFGAAVLPGTRELILGRGSGRSSRLDRVLDAAAGEGWVDLRLPRAPVLLTDRQTIECIAELISRLFLRGALVRCERNPMPTALRPEHVAVGVCHNDQKDLLRVKMQECGLAGVTVQTANKLQGLEFEVVVAWHPLAGLAEPDEFHLDPGRSCVLLTRHRQACVVVVREGDEEMLADQVPPSTPAYLGCTADSVLDGWEVHRGVYGELEQHRIAI